MKARLLLLLLLIGSAVQSQTVKLSLTESIELAIDSSLQAFRAKNQYLSSYWAFRSFKAGRLPSLSFRATPIEYRRTFTPRYDSGTDIDVYRHQQTLNSQGMLSIIQNFDLTGGTFYIDSELGYIRNFTNQDHPVQFSAVPIRIGYRQALFGFNEFKWEKKIEPVKYERAKMQYLYSREEISETTIQYFFSLAMTQMEYNMAVTNVASADTLYRIGQEKHKIASISQADLLTLKLDAVNARNTLKNEEVNLKRAMFAFVTFLHLDKDTQLAIELPDRPIDIEISPDLALQYAKANNPEFLAFKQELLEAEREVDRTKKSSNFEAAFNVSVGFENAEKTFRNAYLHPVQQDIINFGITIPIVDWGVRKGRANMAKNNLNVSKISVQQKELALEQDVVMIVNDFNIQQDLIHSAEEVLELSILAYNITRERFIIGKADLNSLTLSLNRQSSAQRNYISALQNYWLNYYRLRKLTLFDFQNREAMSIQFDRIY